MPIVLKADVVSDDRTFSSGLKLDELDIDQIDSFVDHMIQETAGSDLNIVIEVRP